METVGKWLEGIGAWWANLPSLPDLGLPQPSDADVLLVVATVLVAIGAMVLVSAWVEKRMSWTALLALVLGAAIFFWVWETDREGTGWISIPEAFVEMVARILR